MKKVLMIMLTLAVLSIAVNAQANSSVYCENVLKGVVCGAQEWCAGDTDSLEGNVTCCLAECTSLADFPRELGFEPEAPPVEEPEQGVQFEASYIEELQSTGAYTLYGIIGVLAIFVFIFVIIILTSKRTGKK